VINYRLRNKKLINGSKLKLMPKLNKMEKNTIINEFLEKNDLKEHELVYWKHKVSNGFKL